MHISPYVGIAASMGEGGGRGIHPVLHSLKVARLRRLWFIYPLRGAFILVIGEGDRGGRSLILGDFTRLHRIKKPGSAVEVRCPVSVLKD